MTGAEQDAEHRLAVLTSWGFFGAFSLAIVLSGFRADRLVFIFAGYLLLTVGFVSHLVINRIYRTQFRAGEIATAVTFFGAAALGFLLNWTIDPAFSGTDVLGGLLGLAVVLVCFLAYLATRYGLKGAFSMFHTPRDS